MYQKISATEFKSNLNLPPDYRVDGVLVYGGWNVSKYQKLLEQSLTNCGIEFKVKQMSDFLGSVVEIQANGKNIWFIVAYGGALLSEYLHLACLFGSSKNILIGSCGGLGENLETGDLILVEASFGNESSTRMYSKSKNLTNLSLSENSLTNLHFSDTTLTTKIALKIKENTNSQNDFKLFMGKTTTYQAMLVESLEDIQNWSKEGYLAVEMEAATVLAVSNYFQVPVTCLLCVAENLIKKETVISSNYNFFKEKRVKSVAIQFKVTLSELL